MTVVVLVPVLGRPQRVQPTLDSLRASEREVPLRALFLVCADDWEQVPALERAGADYELVPWLVAEDSWARKINLGYRETSEPWLLLAADDVAFHPGWADEALRVAGTRHARVVGTSDGGRNAHVRGGNWSPHPLVARSYVTEWGGTLDGSGEVVCELYRHNWPDRELAEVARSRGEWAFARHAVVEHLHPNWPGGLPRDATYERGVAGYQEDARLFVERSVMWRKVSRRQVAR